MNDCLFCKIAAGQIPAEIVLDSRDALAFRDLDPQAPQHVLIIPKRHISRLADLRGDDAPAVGSLMTQAVKLAHDLGMDEAGYRLVINNGETAGQSVWHLHIHLLSGRPFHWPPG
ncbi:MAG: histidine triad nucleotide-binding protein [bacterium]|nr:histidine triad nucleotide-binding protein [bacterium]